ncbi:unnamed protein product [Blepharisma stoltei]|uniref:NADH dehydrogenase subunit 5 n=1 Tax=Blepharisma stoltei TaxID=1481888 RepID=A0AAU9J6K5_9CILI|nr:unnamed protein product [Blepharisma stoltei]
MQIGTIALIISIPLALSMTFSRLGDFWVFSSWSHKFSNFLKSFVKLITFGISSKVSNVGLVFEDFLMRE